MRAGIQAGYLLFTPTDEGKTYISLALRTKYTGTAVLLHYFE